MPRTVFASVEKYTTAAGSAFLSSLHTRGSLARDHMPTLGWFLSRLTSSVRAATWAARVDALAQWPLGLNIPPDTLEGHASSQPGLSAMPGTLAISCVRDISVFVTYANSLRIRIQMPGIHAVQRWLSSLTSSAMCCGRGTSHSQEINESR